MELAPQPLPGPLASSHRPRVVLTEISNDSSGDEAICLAAAGRFERAGASVTALCALAATVFGLLLWPLWAFVGPIWASMYFPSIEARLTGRSLVYKHGVWFRQEMSIPLDKIQDLSLHHGPVLDAFGLSTLRVDTAGGGGPGSGSANLFGVVDAAGFRAHVIARRDALVAGVALCARIRAR